ncbi:MAG: two-component regulator propeller domain-containing protein, partial [Bacteroidota bacterium]
MAKKITKGVSVMFKKSVRIKFIVYIILVVVNTTNVYPQQWKRFVNWNEGACVASQNDSIIWVGTHVGLVRWDVKNNNYKTFGLEDGLPTSHINDLKFDKNGILWAATNKGLLKYDGNSFRLLNYQNTNIPNAPITKIDIDSQNNIYALLGWFIENNSYQTGGIITYVSNEWHVYKGNDYNFSYPPGSLVVYKDTAFINVSVGEPQFNCKILYISKNQLREDLTWRYTYFANNFAVDYQDSLWAAVGTQLLKKRKYGWEIVIGENSGLPSVLNFVWSNNINGLWFGGRGPNLYYLNIDMNLRGTRYFPNLPAGVKPIQNNIAGEKFTGQVATSNKLQYFISENGLFQYDLNGNQKKKYQIEKTLENNYVYGLGLSPNNELLVSGPKSTQIFNGDTWQTIG